MASPHNPERQCKYHLKSGRRCSKAAILGGTVCYTHGGAAPQVRAKARERLLDIIDPDRVFREMARIGFADTSRVFDENGNLKPVKDWPQDLRRAVGGLEVVKRNLTSGDGEIDQVIKVKFWDKTKALEQMAKILKMFEEREMTVNVNLVSQLEAARKRVADAARKRS